MRRTGILCLLALACACGGLTEVPPPPVPLSALDAGQASAEGEDPKGTPVQATVRLLRALPSDSLVTLHLPDIGGAVRRFKKTGLYKLLDSPALRRRLGVSEAFAGRFSFGAIPGGSPEAQRLLDALQGEMAISLSDLRLGGTADGVPEVRLVAGISVAGAEREARQLLQFGSALAAQQKGIRVEEGSVAGTPFRRVTGRTPRPWAIECAVYHDALLAGFGRETVTAAIERLNDPARSSLDDNASFLACMKRCADPKDALRVHVDLGALLQKFGPHIPIEVRGVLESLGLTRLRGIAATLRFEGRDIVASSFLDSPGGEDFLTRLLSRHPIDRRFLDRIPPEANSFSLFALDGKAILGRLRDVLPAGPRAGLETGLAVLRTRGIDLERDVFDVFGPRCALVTIPPVKRAEQPLDIIWGRLLATALVIEVQDPVAARKLLDRIDPAAYGWRTRTIAVAGRSGVALHPPSGELPAGFAACYALDDGYLVVAPSERTLERMLRPRSEKTAARFRDVLAATPARAAVLGYEDLRNGPGLGLQMVLQGFASGLRRGLPDSQASGAPSFEPLSMDLGESVSFTVADERGIFSSSRSPTGGLGGIGGLSGLAVMAAIAIPSMHSARIDANEAAALAAIRNLRVAEETYRANVLRDADGDGEGEYGYLSDLLGRRRPGDDRVMSTRRLVGDGFELAAGERDFRCHGYYYRVYLPSEDGSPIGEHEPAARLRQVDGDLAEAIMVIVAWPVKRGSTGNRAFYLDEAGLIHACVEGDYGGRNNPPPDLMVTQAGNLASKHIHRRQTPRDGLKWSLVR